MRHDPYLAHRDFIAPAWALPNPWRIAVVLIGFELAFVLTPEIIQFAFPTVLSHAMFGQPYTPLGTLIEFASFGIVLLLFIGIVKLVNKRGLRSLLGPGDLRTAYWRSFVWVAAVLIVVEIAPPTIDWNDIAIIRPFGEWFVWLVPALIAITLQSATEEIVYRGYLQQQLAVMSKSKWVWMGFPSVLFGSAHYFNGYGPSEGVLWAFWATLLGLACADLTARTGNLGAAIGLHTANNMMAATIVGIEDWPSSGLARYLYAYLDQSQYSYDLITLLAPWAVMEILISTMGVAVMWLAARLAMQR